jgi:hypothetical protein
MIANQWGFFHALEGVRLLDERRPEVLIPLVEVSTIRRSALVKERREN